MTEHLVLSDLNGNTIEFSDVFAFGEPCLCLSVKQDDASVGAYLTRETVAALRARLDAFLAEHAGDEQLGAILERALHRIGLELDAERRDRSAESAAGRPQQLFRKP